MRSWNQQPSLGSLDPLVERLAACRDVRAQPLRVPDILIDPRAYRCGYVSVHDGADFLLRSVDRIRSSAATQPRTQLPGEELGSTMLVDLRSHAAVDGRHGSFLSLIPWLAHYICDLGCRNVVLLPLGPYGRTRRKGSDGSLFALTDHLAVSDEYGDCLVPGLDAREQYRAVVELAASAGVRMGTVQPLATAALDYPHFALNPSLTFWWVADPSEILFSPVVDEWLSGPLAAIIHGAGYRPALREARIPIPQRYAERFVEPPSKSTIRIVHREEGSYFVGKSLYRGRMVDVAIANAIPDVIPDKAEHYAWRDIALLNYWQTHVPSPCMLMGCEETNDTSSAMRQMVSVMCERRRKFGESLFWIDMARCLPSRVRDSAPPSSRFFRTTKLIYEQVSEEWQMPTDRQGAVIGDFLCSVAPRTRCRAEFRMRLFAFLSDYHARASLAEYLAGPGTHDALPLEPRVAALLMVLSHVLPGAQPLLVSGQERFVGEAINAEFGELGTAGYAEEALSLFSCDPDRSARGVPALVLAQTYGLASTARLLPAAAVVREHVRACQREGSPRFARIEGPGGQPDEVGHWTIGRRSDGPWCSVVMRIDAGQSQVMPWEQDWRIVLRPLTPDGWLVAQRPATGTLELAAVDCAIVGGRCLERHWRKWLQRSAVPSG